MIETINSRRRFEGPTSKNMKHTGSLFDRRSFRRRDTTMESSCVCEYEGQRFRFEVSVDCKRTLMRISRLCSRYLRRDPTGRERKGRGLSSVSMRERAHRSASLTHVRTEEGTRSSSFCVLRCILKISPLDLKNRKKRDEVRQPSEVFTLPEIR